MSLFHLVATRKIRTIAQSYTRGYPPPDLLSGSGELEKLFHPVSSSRSHTHYSFFGEVLYFFSEVEVVFGLWCIPIIALISYKWSWQTALDVVGREDYADALFMLVAMVVAATRPIIELFSKCVSFLATSLGGLPSSWWLIIMLLGPLLGSLIKETVAMTIIAALLGNHFFRLKPSRFLSYATMGLLFVNVSIGGMLSNFATTAVALVAERWQWSSFYIFSTFGWRAALSIVTSTFLIRAILNKDFSLLNRTGLEVAFKDKSVPAIPMWITLAHLFFLIWLIFNHSNTVIALSSFVIFLGFCQATAPYQSIMDLKEPILVAFFIASVIFQSDLQSWWISPIIEHLGDFGTMNAMALLSSIQPNPSLTLISSKIPHLTEATQYAVFVGIMVGGGLTLIGNGPNFIAYGMLAPYFSYELSLIKVFFAALLPALIAFVFFLL